MLGFCLLACCIEQALGCGHSVQLLSGHCNGLRDGKNDWHPCLAHWSGCFLSLLAECSMQERRGKWKGGSHEGSAAAEVEAMVEHYEPRWDWRSQVTMIGVSQPDNAPFPVCSGKGNMVPGWGAAGSMGGCTATEMRWPRRKDDREDGKPQRATLWPTGHFQESFVLDM